MVQEVWKQQTLLQLLQLVEVPVLDCILTSPSKPAPLRMRLLRNHDLVISNTCVDREVSHILNLPESVSNTTFLLYVLSKIKILAIRSVKAEIFCLYWMMQLIIGKDWKVKQQH